MTRGSRVVSDMATMVNDHHAGELAYVDTFAGLIPCKVTDVHTITEYVGPLFAAPEARDTKSTTRVQVTLTADRGAYKRGEVLVFHPDQVIPRGSVFTRGHVRRVRNDYRWVG